MEQQNLKNLNGLLEVNGMEDKNLNKVLIETDEEKRKRLLEEQNQNEKNKLGLMG